MFAGALLSLALILPGTGPSEEALVAEVASYAPATAQDQAAHGTDSAGAASSHVVTCRQEVRPNSRFTRKVCRKARDWNQTALAAQGDFESARSGARINIGR